MDPFPCTSCAACCRLIYLDPLSRDLPKRADGSCAHLTDQGQCGIYDDRPWFCDTRVARKHLKPKDMSDRDFVRAIAAGCNRLQLRLGIPRRFRVRVW